MPGPSDERREQNGWVLFADVARVSESLAATSARSRKTALIADCLRAAGPDDVAVVVRYLSGELRQRRTGLGPAALREVPPPAAAPALSVADVDAAFDRIAELAGPGSTGERRRLLGGLLSRATPPEQRLISGLVAGELRQGALGGLVVDAVALASGVPLADVRRAFMLRGELAPVAEAALTDGRGGLDRFRLQVGRPLQPMLAQPADGVAAALARISPAAVEWKLDGIRVQVHRDGSDVAVFTRTLDDVTGQMPELVDAARSLPVATVVLDGEAVALHPDGRPLPFQTTASRAGSSLDVSTARRQTPLQPCFFDVLHADGEDVLGLPLRERHGVLTRAVPDTARVPRLVTDDVAAAGAFLDDALARGHEGVVVKALDVPYEAGRRGGAWLKVKPRHTLDLVVLAAEWGHGRRKGWLSNLHLGARDGEGGGFVMLGKTFKGLTDAMLAWQTERLLALAVARGSWVVPVRPELVVEVAFDGVQTSTRYPAGMALRFARVLRHRPDKPAADADTVATVRSIHLRATTGSPPPSVTPG